VILAVLALTAAGCAGESGGAEDETDAGPSAKGGPYRLGGSYRGHPLEATLPDTYVYGTCEAESDSGCSPPYQVQHHASCARNPLSLDVAPWRVYRMRRGAIAAAYADMIDVGIARHTITVFAPTIGAAARAGRHLRRRSQSAPPPRLPAPVYPTPVLQELKRVVVARERLGSRRQVARETGLHPWQVRTRLRMASLLGRGALAGVEQPGRPWPVVRRERQIALNAIALGRRRAARQAGVSLAELRRMARRVRGLSGRC
jgi:hypothetical protein